MTESEKDFRWCALLRAGVAALVLGLLPQAIRATTIIPPEFATLVNESDYIVHVTTKSVHSEKIRTARGERIFTFVEFDLREVVAGNPPSTLTLRFLGGRVGEEALTVGGMPQFRVGDEDILFVRDNGRSICPLYAMMHGRYIVQKDTETGREYVTRSDGSPLQNTAEIASEIRLAESPPARRRAAALSALEPADFVRQIKAAVKPGARLLREK